MAERPPEPRCPRLRTAFALSWLLLALGSAAAQELPLACGGSLRNGFGPFDYRTTRGHELSLVEGAHFTPQVESLVAGNAGTLGGDLDYTLRAFPNHHRALLSLMRYGERLKTVRPPSLRYSVECYFVRALNFRPDDTTVRLLHAMYLKQTGQPQAMRDELEHAVEQAGDNAFTHYNIGLFYLELQDYERALRQAHRAAALGFPRSELREKLRAAGRWHDAPPANGPSSGSEGPPPPAQPLSRDAQGSESDGPPTGSR